MTEENKAKENARAISSYVKNYFESKYREQAPQSEETIQKWEKLANEIDSLADKTDDPNLRKIRLVFVSLLRQTVAEESRSQIFLAMLSLLAEALDSITRNVSTDDGKHIEELAKVVDDAKLNFDKHVAKRLGELFGKGDEGYIG